MNVGLFVPGFGAAVAVAKLLTRKYRIHALDLSGFIMLSLDDRERLG